ncbi:guanine nucleotide-binding protein G(s) subunit alpha isoforms XLas-like [Aquila chrysaetos chrysaetos]|uniref:guanine nucleotide-binding protein G(s) subunit alpha isoforms XLas-like n=1 Tax=Aquila chrysaetos chrysaetos TaxID=223781 RepID=UPI001B7D3ED2|nr:guanine nucleotide-binding protein G(s) subunit alpha isoforms XLas-like [Aquila chrysaetos chrysaetos]
MPGYRLPVTRCAIPIAPAAPADRRPRRYRLPVTGPPRRSPVTGGAPARPAGVAAVAGRAAGARALPTALGHAPDFPPLPPGAARGSRPLTPLRRLSARRGAAESGAAARGWPPGPPPPSAAAETQRGHTARQMHDAGSPRACIFPAGPCLGCSWLRHAESCRCDLFICLQPPALPPSCFPSPLPPEPT